MSRSIIAKKVGCNYIAVLCLHGAPSHMADVLGRCFPDQRNVNRLFDSDIYAIDKEGEIDAIHTAPERCPDFRRVTIKADESEANLIYLWDGFHWMISRHNGWTEPTRFA